jgi:hypothetical protein
VLPNHDRRELKKIEERMRASDPAFARTFDQGLAPAEDRVWKVLLLSADVTVLLMILTGLLLGDTALFLWGMTAACGLVWAHYARRPESRSRPAA